jgi:hypothetical protein
MGKSKKVFVLIIFFLLNSVSYGGVHVSGSWGFTCGRLKISDGNIFYKYQTDGFKASGSIKNK